MNYGEILGRSWKIFWEHKILWVIGIIPYVFYSLLMIPLFLIPLFMLQSNPADIFNRGWIWIVFSIILPVFMLGYIVLMVWSKAANSVGILQAEKGQEHLSFSELIRQGGRYFWRILGLYAIFIGAMLVLYLVVFGFMFLLVIASFGVATFCIFPFIFLLIPIVGVGYLLAEQSNAAIIVEELDVIEGLKCGWEVLKKNFWKLILMVLILYAGSYVITTIATIPLYGVMFVPMMVPMMTNNMDSFYASYSYMMIGMMIFMPFLMVFTGILYTYVRNAWMLTYISLTRPVPETASTELVNA